MRIEPFETEADPPRWLDYILRIVTDRQAYESVSGDLLEEYREVVLPRDGAAAAHRWYRKQVLSFVTTVQIGLTLGAVSSFMIIVMNIAFPLLRIEIPDGRTTQGLCQATSFAGALLSWGFAGILAGRKSQAFASPAQAGMLAAFLHVAMMMLTFVVIDNLFLHAVSQQPDKVWGLQHCGYQSMRAYVNYGALRGLYMVLPALVAAGAVSGAIGASIDTLFLSMRAATR